MKLMVIGGGGREHAIIKKLKENPAVTEIYALPGNGGIAADATCVDIGAKDIPAQVEFAKANGIDYAVVAPDDPLALGAVDALTSAGIPCFGPDAKAAVIESSKAFSKDLMKKYGIPTAAYATFTDARSAEEYLDGCKAPIVVKAEYYWGTRCWWVFLVLGLLGIAGSLLTDQLLLSSLLGVFSFSSFWTIKEIFEQRERVLKGWFPMNPRRKHEYTETTPPEGRD